MARVEKRPSLDSITIDSINFDLYLLKRGFDARESQFSSELDLGIYAPIFERLYSWTKQGFVYSDREKEHKLGVGRLILETSSIRDRPNDPAREEIMGLFEEEASRRAPVERSSVVYFDRKERAIKASPVEFGTVNEVKVSTADLSIQGNIPLVEIHTHNNNSLFSPNDYQRMLIDPGNATRWVKSAIVLCPDIQVLALATRNTPLLNDYKASIQLLELKADYLIGNSVVAGCLKVARELNIKLYSSTDKRHFKAFSA